MLIILPNLKHSFISPVPVPVPVPDPDFHVFHTPDQISSQTMTWNRYNTLGSIDITHRHKYNLFLHNPALSC